MREITRELVDHITQEKLKENVKPSTVNRLLEVVRAILRKAEREWEWLEKAPFIRMLQASRLIAELPPHLADMAVFALLTGLRMSNITGLQWSEVDLVKQHTWIHPDQAVIPPFLTDIKSRGLSRQS